LYPRPVSALKTARTAFAAQRNSWLQRLVEPLTLSSSLIVDPKIILDRAYNSSIDWWQLGIITYQMMTQQSPFQGDTEDDIYDSILASEPLFPADMTTETIDFVQSLLIKEPAGRLGSGRNGPSDVMAHAFFSGINWVDVYQKRVPVPFIPIVTSYTDVSNFDPELTGLGTPLIVDTDPGMCRGTRGLELICD
jgi:serine/threonine protein kinase